MLSHLTGHFSTVFRRVHKIAKSDYSLGHVRRPFVRMEKLDSHLKKFNEI
jgi:hypothetical protein